VRLAGSIVCCSPPLQLCPFFEPHVSPSRFFAGMSKGNRVLLTLLSAYNVLFLQVSVFCSSEGTGDCVVVCAGSIFSELSNLLCACRDLASRTLSVLSCFIFAGSQELLGDVLCMLSTMLTHHFPELSVSCLISAGYLLPSCNSENMG